MFDDCPLKDLSVVVKKVFTALMMMNVEDQIDDFFVHDGRYMSAPELHPKGSFLSHFDDQNSPSPETSGPIIDICSLNEMCVRVILDGGFPNTIDEAAAMCLRIPDMSSIPNYRNLWDRVHRLLKDRASMVLECYDSAELERCFGPDIILSLRKMNVESVDAKKKMANYRKGEVIEREGIGYGEHNSINGFYPVEALMKGVQWPKNVDPTKREEYLTPEEFVTVFKMSKKTFSQLATYVKIRLKQENDLF